jgi:CubicO group peptidase (beta-lactamase class C family)
MSAVRIEQLLSHTSGISSNTDTPAYGLLTKKHENREEMVRYYANQPMEFPAGSKWKYNNANYYMLGFIIEKITGKSYESYLDENIFKPAGMLHSYVANNVKLIPKRASGYINGRLGIINANLNDVKGWYASGGIMSTAEDMYRWNRACRSGILVKKETLEKAFVRQKLSDGALNSYGFGWHIQNLHGSTTHRHGGAVPGFIAETLYLPDEDVFVVMLLNSESKVPSTALTRMIAGLVINKPYRFAEIKLSEAKQGSYQGSYRNGAGELINITEADGKVYFQRPGGNKYTIKPSTVNEFFFDKDYLWVEFKQDANGKINGLIFSQVGIGDMIWKKLD